ncbi:CinA family protein [Pseudactinotalea sp. Z1739]|uniref:CinA family protein n=1 Tax=Pseudactinotalea sp. Z1739 TaxID=3413028 RepID=UPI003C7AFFCF
MSASEQLRADFEELAARVGKAAHARGALVATAESLTSGQVAVHLGAAPDAGDWFAGGVVAYTVEAKQRALGVPPGPVISEQCATAMAEGAAQRLGADCAVGVTGVGGPDEQEGEPVGTVFIAVHTPEGTTCEQHHFDGDAEEILDATTRRALELLGQGITDVGTKAQ